MAHEFHTQFTKDMPLSVQPRLRVCRFCGCLELRWLAELPFPRDGAVDGVFYYLPASKPETT